MNQYSIRLSFLSELCCINRKAEMLKKAMHFIQNKTPPASTDQDEDPGIPRVYGESYFYGRITRQEAEEILTINGKEDGLYLLRESITPMGNFSLSMAFRGKCVSFLSLFSF